MYSDNDQQFEMYRRMLRIRQFELAASKEKIF